MKGAKETARDKGAPQSLTHSLALSLSPTVDNQSAHFSYL